MEEAVASSSKTATAAAPAAAHKKCEPVNVQVKEDGVCKIYYNVKGAASVSWDFVERDGEFYAVFETTVNGVGYYNESLPIPAEVKELITVEKKEARKDYFKVKLLKKKGMKIGSYFAKKA